jgi:hypothetical protein
VVKLSALFFAAGFSRVAGGMARPARPTSATAASPAPAGEPRRRRSREAVLRDALRPHGVSFDRGFKSFSDPARPELPGSCVFCTTIERARLAVLLQGTDRACTIAMRERAAAHAGWRSVVVRDVDIDDPGPRAATALRIALLVRGAVS